MGAAANKCLLLQLAHGVQSPSRLQTDLAANVGPRQVVKLDGVRSAASLPHGRCARAGGAFCVHDVARPL